MKKIKYINYYIALAMFCAITSCKKLVEVNAPTNSLTTTNVFNNDATAITAQFPVYADLPSSLVILNVYAGLSSDELTNYSTNQFYIDAYNNNLNAQNDGSFNGTWALFYKYIYQENAIIENVKTSSGMSVRVKQLMTGEALFMRAYCYFQLINMFGNVPLVVNADYTQNSSLSRTPVSQVYSQIVNDLQTAQGLLSTTYLDPSDNPGATDRVRPTTWAADALLARVYLYMGKYDLAEQQASMVIANTGMFKLVTDLNKVFKMNSNEAIWQLTPQTGQLYTYLGRAFILTTPPSSSDGQVAISPQLLGAFETNDNRKTNWIGIYSQSGTTWYFPYKYKDNNTATTLSEYTMVLRLAEQFLIRAEARAQQGKISGANSAESDVNAIRSRAGLPNTTATTLTTMLTAIAHERQVELFSEQDRWFDLKRTKTVDAVMGVVTPQKTGGLSWNGYQQLYPLSPTDIQLDPNLSQNTGY